MSLTNEELYAEVEEAQDLLLQVIEKLEQVVTERPGVGRYYQAYIVDHLKTMASADHNFLSRDANLDDWKRELEEAETEESEEACS